VSTRARDTTAAFSGGTERTRRIFLNYRRDDSSGYAGRLYDDLAERLDDYDVFMDIDKIEPGADFVDVIDYALDRCDVVLAVIGRHWLTVTDGTGRRRLDDPDDYVRLELETALARGMRLIPVRVQGAEMPSSSELPESLRGLARRQAIALSDTRWQRDVEDLADTLEQIANQTAERERAEQEQRALEEAERRRAADEQAERERRARNRVEREEADQRRAERKEEGRRLAEERRRAQEQARREREARKRAEREQRERGPAPAPRRTPDKLGARAVLAACVVATLAIAGVLAFVVLGGDDAASPNAVAETPLPTAGTSREMTGTFRAGNTVRARRGSWQGAPTAFSFEWRRCERAGGDCRTIVGANSVTYRLRDDDVGRRLRVAVTASNDAGSRTIVTKASPLVLAALRAPTNEAQPTISGSLREGSKLRALPGKWEGSKPIKRTYRWLRCGPDGSACTRISGARDRTYVLGSRDVGRRIRVEERATNRAGARTARSAASSLVATERSAPVTPPATDPPNPPPASDPPQETDPPIEIVPPGPDP
jgi:hypothetical protein